MAGPYMCKDGMEGMFGIKPLLLKNELPVITETSHIEDSTPAKVDNHKLVWLANGEVAV